MQQLIEQLFAGTIEYKDDQIIRHPPNSIMLQAGRFLQQVRGSLETNQILINQLQTHQDEHIATIQQLRVEINELQRRIQELSESKPNLQESGNLAREASTNSESLRESEQQTSDVGSSDGQPGGSDPDSQRSGTN